jgi:hypothetical protein
MQLEYQRTQYQAGLFLLFEWVVLRSARHEGREAQLAGKVG